MAREPSSTAASRPSDSPRPTGRPSRNLTPFREVHRWTSVVGGVAIEEPRYDTELGQWFVWIRVSGGPVLRKTLAEARVSQPPVVSVQDVTVGTPLAVGYAVKVEKVLGIVGVRPDLGTDGSLDYYCFADAGVTA